MCILEQKEAKMKKNNTFNTGSKCDAFLKGAGSVMDIRGNNFRNWTQSDSAAIHSDWAVVGKDISRAIEVTRSTSSKDKGSQNARRK
jgi:hypothetical protein